MAKKQEQKAAPKAPSKAQIQKALQRKAKLERNQKRDEAKRMKREAQRMMKESKEEERRRLAQRRHADYLQTMVSKMGDVGERPITEIPELTEDFEQVQLAEIVPGAAYVRIVYDLNQTRHEYQVHEPVLGTEEIENLEFLKDTLTRTMSGIPELTDKTPAEYLEEQIADAIVDHALLVDEISRQRLSYYLHRDLLGFGPIDVIMQDPMIEDISCDGPEIPLYIFHRKLESLRTNVAFKDDLELDSYVIRLAQRSGKHISIARPILDATLPDGSRLQATLSREVTTRGSSFTIRKFNESPITSPMLVNYGTMDARLAAYFWFVLETGSSLIYAGGTASGKTTSLNAVCQFIPPAKKVVSIEDTREINIDHENWIAGLTRVGFGDAGAGEISMYKLLEAALRQRPEYLLVGEVRGEEARTLFQAMATGHAVYSTMHADSVASAVHRLEHPPINVPRILIPIMDVMAIQVQVRVQGKMARRVKEVVELMGVDPETDDILTNTVFKWNQAEDKHDYLGRSVILEGLAAAGLGLEKILAEWDRRTYVLQWLADHKVTDARHVSQVIDDYYRDAEAVIARMEGKNGDKS